MVLMIQTELCEKKTLKNWLSDHIHDRKRKTVVNFFEQVHVLLYKVCDDVRTDVEDNCLIISGVGTEDAFIHSLSQD